MQAQRSATGLPSLPSSARCTARRSQHGQSTPMPVSSEGDRLSVASQVMRAQVHVRSVEKQRARGRSTCSFQQIGNCGRPANSNSSLLYEEKNVYALPFAQHSTAVDCCFLDDAHCRWSNQEAKTLDHTSVGCQSLARSRALGPAAIVLLQLQHSKREHSRLVPQNVVNAVNRAANT